VQWCLRLVSPPLSGRIVYAPLLSLIHYESKSRGFDFQDPAKQQRAEYERHCLESGPWVGALDQRDHHPLLSPWAGQEPGLL